MAALIWTTVAIYIKAEREAAEKAAIRNSGNLARMLEAHLSRSLTELDRSLRIILRNYLLYPEGFDFDDWMHGTLLSDDQIVQLSILRPDGFLAATSMDSPPAKPVDLSDREHFRIFAEDRSRELYISQPIVGRVSGRTTIQFARRIDLSDGSFGGVIVASIDPQYFARVYSSVDLGQNGRIVFLGHDGTTRAIGGGAAEPSGLDHSGSELIERVKRAGSGWFYTGDLPGDGVRRLVAYRALDGFPLIVAISQSTQELFAPLEEMTRWSVGVALALTALILGFAGYSVRSRMALERATEKIREQNRQRDAALENMSQGLSMFDRDGRLMICNNQYLQIYGLSSREIRPGLLLDEVLRIRQSKGAFAYDVDSYVAELRARLAAGASVTLTTTTPDGRTVVVVNCPLADGGWVATHEDVTRRSRAEWELDRTKRFLHTVIENLPVAILVKDPVDLRYTLVNRAAEQLLGVGRHDILGRAAEDFWEADQARAIARRDHDILRRIDSEPLVAKSPVRTPDGVDRIVNTRRLLVRDKNREPQHLISVIEDVTERERAEARIVFMANHDPLTGLANRTLFGRTLEAALAELKPGERLAVMFVDLDRFKEINDTQGHFVGDKVLRAAADRLRACVGLGQGNSVARLGGDEFAVILRHVESDTDISSLADRIQVAIGEPFEVDGGRANVGVSIGIAIAPQDAGEAADLLKRADIALYRAKAEGRNTFRFFEAKMDERLQARRLLESDLCAALAADALELHYQPILRVRDDAIVGLEALLRWRDPVRGMISPAEFIPIAEETGLIVPLGEWVIRRACADAARWPQDIKIAINLSPAQFGSKSLAPTFVSALAASGIAPERIELEITEQIVMRDDPEHLATLQGLRSLGMRIVMDDFGTGYSSLSYLHRFTFDKIKIDRSFVSGIADGNDVSLAIIETVASLAETIKVPTVAEGIETEAQLELVRGLGCTEYQGFLFSPPRPAHEIEAMIFGGAANAASAA